MLDCLLNWMFKAVDPFSFEEKIINRKNYLIISGHKKGSFIKLFDRVISFHFLHSGNRY
jgi:hypothetical protein